MPGQVPYSHHIAHADKTTRISKMKFTSTVIALAGAAAIVSASPIAVENAAVADPTTVEIETVETVVKSAGGDDYCKVNKRLLWYEYFVSGNYWNGPGGVDAFQFKHAIDHCGAITGWEFFGAYPDS